MAIPLPLAGRVRSEGGEATRTRQHQRVTSRPPSLPSPMRGEEKIAAAKAAKRARGGRRIGLPFRRVIVAIAGAFLAGKNLLGDQPGVLPDGHLDLARDVGIGLEEGLGVLAAL